MDSVEKQYPEVGVRFKKRYIEYRGKKGKHEIIETVGEVEDSWEGEKRVYRYGVHWMPQYGTFGLERYEQFSACAALDKYPQITVPESLLEQLRELAMMHFFLRVSYGDILEAMRSRWITPGTKIQIFFTKKTLPYRLEFVRLEDGSLARTLAENKKFVRGASARNGGTSIPSALCHAAHRKAVECFRAEKFELPGPQSELFDLSEEPEELSPVNA